MPLRGITPRSGVGVSAAYAPGAVREKFSVLDLSRKCGKFRSAISFKRFDLQQFRVKPR
jgi:hypothetical protein